LVHRTPKLNLTVKKPQGQLSLYWLSITTGSIAFFNSRILFLLRFCFNFCSVLFVSHSFEIIRVFCVCVSIFSLVIPFQIFTKPENPLWYSLLFSYSLLFFSFTATTKKQRFCMMHHDTLHTEAARTKLNDLFVSWLALPDTQKYVSSLLDHCRSGDLQPLLKSTDDTSALSASLLPIHHTPPRSPKHVSPVRTSLHIPALPISKKATLSAQELSAEEKAIAMLVPPSSGSALSMEDFCLFCKQSLHLPYYVSSILYEPVYMQGKLALFYTKYLAPYSTKTRVFHVFLHARPLEERPWARKNPSVLYPRDFDLFLRKLIVMHPGLTFLQSTPEFQERYLEAVRMRILLAYNATSGSLSEREFVNVKHLDFFDVMAQLDASQDITSILRLFSYEHFYVLYCKFWELDTDHDLRISKDELARYGNYSITPKALTHIVKQLAVLRKARLHAMGEEDECPEDCITYEDFVWWCICEEDKVGCQAALEFWFRVVDFDGDGVISAYEVEHFWTDQRSRMEALGQESIMFDDIYCQLLDMVKPRIPHSITISDLKRAGVLTPLFYNTLVNLNKFLSWEQRDPFAANASKGGDGVEKTEWDRFARNEYDRMAHEPEDDNADDVLSSWG
jgi:serine/threonine-protein phosphatase 2A regulatory subunit B''